MSTNTTFAAIDHVQLAMPAGEEERARAFYVGVLGMRELPKPPALADRGGVWFVSGTVQIHLGIDPDFKAAKKAHPALQCVSYDALLTQIRAVGIEVHLDNVPLSDGSEHAYIADPFGNRIELICESSLQTIALQAGSDE